MRRGKFISASRRDATIFARVIILYVDAMTKYAY